MMRGSCMYLLQRATHSERISIRISIARQPVQVVKYCHTTFKNNIAARFQICAFFQLLITVSLKHRCSVYNSSWPEIQPLLSRGGGGGGRGGGGGSSSADSTSTLLTSCIVHVYFTRCTHWELRWTFSCMAALA